jgi:5-methylcytosine-specific restriction endonuclease McrA
VTRVNSRAKRDENHRILKESDVCWLCGHPGSDGVDHKIPLARGGDDELSNKAPAHHDNPCPTCGIKCNRVKGDKLVAPIVRRSGVLNR